MKKGTLL